MTPAVKETTDKLMNLIQQIRLADRFGQPYMHMFNEAMEILDEFAQGKAQDHVH